MLSSSKKTVTFLPIIIFLPIVVFFDQALEFLLFSSLIPHPFVEVLLFPPFPRPFLKTWLTFFSGGPKICNEIHLDWRDPPPFSENSLFLPPQNFRKNRNEIFRIGNDPPPHSEVFRKFIEFGTDSLP